MTQTVLVHFNFCPIPLNKNSIVKIIVSIEDQFLLKDALLTGIKNFNKQSASIRLVEISEKYKMKLSKKSGLPDMDLPGKYFYSNNSLAISVNLKICDANFLNFSVAVENEHLQMIPQKVFTNNNNLNGPFNNLNETFINEKNARGTLYVNCEENIPVKSNSCCGNLLANIKNIFKKKK